MNAKKQAQPLALEHIARAVAANQIPDLTILKSLYLKRVGEYQKRLNKSLAQQRLHEQRGEEAVMRMMQRHQLKDIPQPAQQEAIDPQPTTGASA